jgi:hypothetical protein
LRRYDRYPCHADIDESHEDPRSRQSTNANANAAQVLVLDVIEGGRLRTYRSNGAYGIVCVSHSTMQPCSLMVQTEHLTSSRSRTSLANCFEFTVEALELRQLADMPFGNAGIGCFYLTVALCHSCFHAKEHQRQNLKDNSTSKVTLLSLLLPLLVPSTPLATWPGRSTPLTKLQVVLMVGPAALFGGGGLIC